MHGRGYPDIEHVRRATGLALVIYELATISLNYGSLSVGHGTLDVSGTLDGDVLVLAWIEQGGPEVVAPKGTGYGSKMLERTMCGHLGGSIGFNWTSGGALVNLKIDCERLAT